MSVEDAPEPCELIPNCPICGGKLTIAHAHSKLRICVCKACGTSLSIPDEAWTRARLLRARKN